MGNLLDDIEAQISSMMYQNTELKTWCCSVCGKESKLKSDISRHIDSMHIIDHPGYNCYLCSEILKSRESLRKHIRYRHANQ